MEIENLTFDIITTNKCNLACKYCIENEYTDYHCHDNVKYDIDKLISFIDNMLNDGLNTISVNFWGGEPTLETDAITNILDYYNNSKYMKDGRINFFISTNGYKVDKLLSCADKYKYQTVRGNPFFKIQVSYDGRPINNIKRLNKNGKDVTDDVIETILHLQNNNIPYVLKSTITFDMLRYMYEAYNDIVNVLHAGNYFPTLDYRNSESDNMTDDELTKYKDDIKHSLKLIAKDEIKYMRQNVTQSSNFAWFNHNVAECTAGNNMYAIDSDGTIYQCHGCLLLESKSDHIVGNIVDININNAILNNRVRYKAAIQKYDFICNKCDATFCLRCNAAKYAASNKSNYFDKWFDYGAQNRLCMLYRYISNIARAVRILCGNN